MKRNVSILLAAAVVLTIASSSWASSSGYSLIVTPSRFSVVQVLFDVIQKRPSVIVSYQEGKSPDQPLLHVWNGNSWNQIALHDLRELNFLQRSPTRAILIGNDDLLPASVRDALSWMPELIIIRQLENAALLNELGRVMKWNKSEWRWFSSRYNLDLEDEAAALRRSSWYDQPGPKAKQGATSYQPAPYSGRPAPANLPPAVVRPSDLPATTAPAQEESVDIQALVDALEQSETNATPAANEETYPIK